MGARAASQRGFTLTELLVALVIAGFVVAALGGVVRTALEAEADTSARNAATREARFAMQRMVAAVGATRRLLIPMPENPATAWSESAREPGVLAVTLDPALDRDRDGFADADNDGDGRVDEDLPGDTTNDGEAGIMGIDDDGDGLVDEGGPGFKDDDDEDGVKNEDRADGADADGDGAIDEDPPDDMSGDGEAGIAGVDDDGDGFTDEGSKDDDDEDGATDEDWLDPVVYYLSGTTLVERRPNLNPADGSDFTERTIADNVSRFRVERLPRGANRAPLVDITLEVATPAGAPVILNARVRAGGAR